MTISFEGFFEGCFGDERLAKRARSLAEKITAGETSVVRQLASGRAETVAFGRFLDNEAVTTSEIFTAAGAETGKRSAGNTSPAMPATTTDITDVMNNGRLPDSPRSEERRVGKECA